MENYQKPGVGAGIITISVLQFIGAAFSLLGILIETFFQDSINSSLSSMGLNTRLDVPPVEIFISFVLVAALVISLILILQKKAAGVYIYFVSVIITVIFNIITNGIGFSTFTGLVLPILMAVFISQKKELYGFGNGTGNSMYQ